MGTLKTSPPRRDRRPWWWKKAEAEKEESINPPPLTGAIWYQHQAEAIMPKQRTMPCDYCGCQIEDAGKPNCKQCGAPVKSQRDILAAALDYVRELGTMPE